MKELTVEQKAKRYDEAIERAKEFKEHLLEINEKDYADEMDYVFPELAESEDKKIRKALIDYFRWNPNSQLLNEFTNREVFAWLEKQGEKPQGKSALEAAKEEKVDNQNCVNPADKSKIKPKFKTGDRVIGIVSGMPYFITEVCDDHYNTESGCIIMFCSQDNFELYEQKPIEWSEEDEENFKHLMNEIVCLGNSRNSANRLYYDRLIKFIEELKNRVQPKEKWCNKDERMLDRLIAYFEKQVAFTDDDNPRYANWLKSLKERLQVQPRQEWSEEEIEKAAQEWDSKANFNPFYMTMEGNNPTGVKQDITTHEESFKAGVNWILKSLKGRVQPKQEWSEENEITRNSLINLVEMYYGGCIDKTEKNRLLNFLKSLRPQNKWISVDEEVYVKEPVLAKKKDKSDPFGGFVVCCDHTLTPNVYERYMILGNIVSQNTWKPSDEQIKALEHFVRSVGESGYASPYDNNTKLLYSLLSDLKKLKE